MNKRRHRRKILIVTGSRGEYGYIRPVIRAMQASDTIVPRVLATNMHLLPEFGMSVRAFSEDDLPVDFRTYMTLAGYKTETMVKSLGVFMLSIADILGNEPPDVILLAGDRGEQMVGAIAGAHMNIPVAHIQAGELSGNIDGMTRHAITKYAHIHFAANEDAAVRLEKMGEQPFRIHNVGAPQLDEFLSLDLLSLEELCHRYHLDHERPFLLLVQHSVTEEMLHAYEQMKATLKAIIQLGMQTLLIFPNSDAGSASIRRAIDDHLHPNIHIERNIDRSDYASMMRWAVAIIGNSSSGLIEAPSFELPAVNIGRRQLGRLRGRNVIDIPEYEPKAIMEGIQRAIEHAFRKTLKGMENPYGDGKSSERIVNVLENLEITEELLYKELTY